MFNTELIRDYLNRHGLEDVNIKTFAKQVGVSHSAISRFVTKAGFSSYHEFKKYYLKKQTLNQNALLYNDGNYLFSISRFLNNFNYQKLDFMVQNIWKKQKVILISKIFAEQASNYFYTLLRKINFPVLKYNSASEIDIIAPEKNAVFIFISFSGKNQDFPRIINKIKDQCQKSTFFLLTVSSKSPLSPLMHETLNGYFYQEQLDNFEIPLMPYTIMTIMINMIFDRLYHFNKEHHNLIINKWKKRS